MTDREVQIIDMLVQGFTYTQIQNALHVSPKVISALKKDHASHGKYSNDATSTEHFPHEPYPPPEVFQPESQRNDIKTNQPNKQFTPKQRKPMNTDDDYFEEEEDLPLSKLEVEKYKLKLAHKLEMEKLQTQREEKDRELTLKEKEIQLKREELSNSIKSKEEEKKLLLFRIKKSAETCEDGEYSYDEADNLLSELKKLLSDCEQYCFLNGINFPGTESHTLLNNAISTVVSFIEEFDDEEYESMDLEFDSSFRRIVARMKFQAF